MVPVVNADAVNLFETEMRTLVYKKREKKNPPSLKFFNITHVDNYFSAVFVF